MKKYVRVKIQDLRLQLTVFGLWLAACSFISCSEKKSESIIEPLSITKYAEGFRITEIKLHAASHNPKTVNGNRKS